MNIDERIEAIAQSLALLSQIHQDNEREYNRRFQENEVRFKQTEARVNKLAEFIERLARVAESHENRITGLEDRE